MMKKMLGALSCLVAIILLFGGCQKNERGEMDYLPVQMHQGGYWSIVDEDGNEVVKEEYPPEAKISFVREGVYWVQTNGKYQLYSIDQPKRPLTGDAYDRVTPFRGGHAAVSVLNEQIRIINTSGQTVAVLPKNIRRCYGFSEDGYAVFEKEGGQMGLLDVKGHVVVNGYAQVMPVSDGAALARTNADDGQWLIISGRGVVSGSIDDDSYALLTDGFHEGKIAVRRTKDDGHPLAFLDKTGHELFSIGDSRQDRLRATDHQAAQENIEKTYIYKDGYVVFPDGSGHYGVVDSLGHVAIRAKYAGMLNLGHGEFLAIKGTRQEQPEAKVVNADDETVIDHCCAILRIGENFLAYAGTGAPHAQRGIIVDRQGRELASFDNVGGAFEPHYAEYVDVKGVANALYAVIESHERPRPIARLAQSEHLSVDDFRYKRYLEQTATIDQQTTAVFNIYYDGELTEEKTHVEKVGYGWFTFDRTVSDGYQWSDAMPYRTVGTITSQGGMDLGLFYRPLADRMADGRRKIADNEFLRIVRMNGKQMECRTRIEVSGKSLGIEINFRPVTQ